MSGADKLHEYQGAVGRLHAVRDRVSRRVGVWRDDWAANGGGLAGLKAMIAQKPPEPEEPEDYSHIYRLKTRGELVRISAAVMGIEFSYAAETAFVSPTLLKIGVAHRHMTLVWGLSPLIGFFLTPVLGSLSDRCGHSLGRRRPFILALAAGVFLGLLLVPNGESIGYMFGDSHGVVVNTTFNHPDLSNVTLTPTEEAKVREKLIGSHPWGILFTVLGTVMLDFDADACQSPARAYLLDVTQPEDHARGLSTFTIMAGLGGSMGYALGGINWDNTALGALLGGHVRAVFSLITVIFVICVAATITSFREIPLALLSQEDAAHQHNKEMARASIQEEEGGGTMQTSFQGDGSPTSEPQGATQDGLQSGPQDGLLQPPGGVPSYGTLDADQVPTNIPPRPARPSRPPRPQPPPAPDDGYVNYGFEDIEQPIATQASLRHYLLSIIHMPGSLRILCATNLFCWSAHVCYSLYFTDFVGEAVFGGDPQAAEGSHHRGLYEEGVRFGCWGMAMYSLSCACYSSIIDRLVKRFKAKRVYVGGQLVYCTGMSLLALTRHRAGVIIFSWTAGVMYSTLFTMPYLLVAHYHAEHTFSATKEVISPDLNLDPGTAPLNQKPAIAPPPQELRGLGTDVALVSSMVFLAQLLLSACMGAIVSWAGTTAAVVCVAAVLSFCGAICATQVLYLDL